MIGSQRNNISNRRKLNEYVSEHQQPGLFRQVETVNSNKLDSRFSGKVVRDVEKLGTKGKVG